MAAKPGNPWLWAAWAAALPVLAAPIGDPDLWWHLSAARWMAEHGRLPRADWLSYTMAGQPWVDFEWLAQLIFYAVHACAGLAGLWALKAALLAGSGVLLCGLMKELDIDAPRRGAALALWAAALIPRADIRTELFSVLLFAWLLRGLLLDRLKAVPVFFLFALWANLHAGFAYGLALLGLWSLGEARPGLWFRPAALLAAAGAGALLNPYGAAVYKVIGSHVMEIGALRPFIAEWRGLSLRRPGHWPACFLMIAALWTVVQFWFEDESARRRIRLAGPKGATLALAGFAALAVRHGRAAAYFATLAVPAGLGLARVCGFWAKPGKTVRLGAGAALAVLAGFSLWCGFPARVFRRVSHDAYAPVLAAAYLEKDFSLDGMTLYHPWGWGGYLGFRLYPRFRIFQDGRYIFHSLLIEAGGATRSPESWQDFLARYGANLALMENIPLRFSGRPYYLSYMPRERWALIHWDDKALLFARRGSLPREKLEALEYRLTRPGDDEALNEALQRGEIDVSELGFEKTRHERELAELARRGG